MGQEKNGTGEKNSEFIHPLIRALIRADTQVCPYGNFPGQAFMVLCTYGEGKSYLSRAVKPFSLFLLAVKVIGTICPTTSLSWAT